MTGLGVDYSACSCYNGYNITVDGRSCIGTVISISLHYNMQSSIVTIKPANCT